MRRLLRAAPSFSSVCHEIENFAYNLANDELDDKVTSNELHEQLTANYPFLTPSRLERTISQARYFCRK